uniref:Uncharacterized protein n=1 Tax=Rangifer tarandus platyrhynchus TaxID=3082113 RepID=A0ACB0FEA0_RANTA|nr:unnamed protein product [Rangifer tarandus platyrhynchus]
MHLRASRGRPRVGRRAIQPGPEPGTPEKESSAENLHSCFASHIQLCSEMRYDGGPSLKPAAPRTPAGEAGPLRAPLLLKSPACSAVPQAAWRPSLEREPGDGGASSLPPWPQESTEFFPLSFSTPTHPDDPRLASSVQDRLGEEARCGPALLRLQPVVVCPPLPASACPCPRAAGQWAPPGAHGSLALFPGVPHGREGRSSVANLPQPERAIDLLREDKARTSCITGCLIETWQQAGHIKSSPEHSSQIPGQWALSEAQTQACHPLPAADASAAASSQAARHGLQKEPLVSSSRQQRSAAGTLVTQGRMEELSGKAVP